jgi:hypothetical protein
MLFANTEGIIQQLKMLQTEIVKPSRATYRSFHRINFPLGNNKLTWKQPSSHMLVRKSMTSV